MKIGRTMNISERVDKTFSDLFPFNRSLTGRGVLQTFEYIKENFLPNAEVKSVASGSKVFDWEIPDEWNIFAGYVLNANGKKIIDFEENNLHVVSYSTAIDKIVEQDELLKHIHTLSVYPDRIPYRTSYYKKNWGFCCTQELVDSELFIGPFRAVIDSHHDKKGKLHWLECVKPGALNDEILISTYCCHPSLANDNLSGIVLALFLFDHLSSIDTKYTYRLVIVPETIGAIAFLSQATTNLIKGGMVLSCVAGPDPVSLKEGFDRNHFMNKAAHLAIKQCVGEQYTTYPFAPDGSDERQYSTPGLRIVTPSIHKSKYYEYDQYHTSADNLDYISSKALCETLDVYKEWIQLIESFCFPKRKEMFCEFQLGRRNLYPSIGGTLNQSAHDENIHGSQRRGFSFNEKIDITGGHLDAFNWLMHLADGSISNFEISEISGLNISIINEAIGAMYQKDLLELK